MRERGRREEGQVLLALLMFLVTVLSLALMLFQVGRGTDLRARAQTAADAAALAGAREIAKVAEMSYGAGAFASILAAEGLAWAAAQRYAADNGAIVTQVRLDPVRLEVYAAVVTVAALTDKPQSPANPKRAVANATARVEFDKGVCRYLGTMLQPTVGGACLMDVLVTMWWFNGLTLFAGVIPGLPSIPGLPAIPWQMMGSLDLVEYDVRLVD
jgi:hypothetical protein